MDVGALKVLIISQNPFSSSGNNGKTLESIFKSFKKEDLAQLYFNGYERPDFDYCDNYFCISEQDVLLHAFDKDHVGHICEREDTNYEEPKRTFRFRALSHFFWSFGRWKSQGLIRWVSEFNPDVFFFVGGNVSYAHDVSIFLSEHFRKPLASYFTDDYVIYPEPKSMRDRICLAALRRKYRKTISHSGVCFAIGEEMSKEYGKYFGKEFFPVMNIVDRPEDGSQVLLDIVPDFNKVYISYYGSLYYERWKMVADFAHLVRLTDEKDGCVGKHVVRLFTTSKIDDGQKRYLVEAGVLICNPVFGDSLAESMRESAYLLHVESDDACYRSKTRLSVSTKIPEYLFSGRCIIAYGPLEVASMKLLLDNQIACVISSEWPREECLAALGDLFHDRNKYDQITRRALAYSQDKFNAKKIREDFYERLSSMTEG